MKDREERNRRANRPLIRNARNALSLFDTSLISGSYLHLAYLCFCHYRSDKPFKALTRYFILLASYRYFTDRTFTTKEFISIVGNSYTSGSIQLSNLTKGGYYTRISRGKYVISAKGIDVCLDAVRYCDANFNILLP